MKTRKEIIEAILFHEKQYRELKRMPHSGEPNKSIHQGQAIALRWVIGERTTASKALRAELLTSA